MISKGVGRDFQTDLSDMQNVATENEGYRYILCVIDIFSKKAYCRAIKHKSGEEVRDAFKVLAREAPELYGSDKSTIVASDAGKEYLNEPVQKWFTKHGIKHYTLQGDHKAAIVERFQRTLKERIYRIFTQRESYKYIDLLPTIVDAYNRTEHRSLGGLRPIDITAGSVVERELFDSQFDIHPRQITRGDKDDIQVGDTVLISTSKSLYDKGYTGYWRQEPFTVATVKQGVPNKIYILRERNGELVQGGFYREQVQKIPPVADDEGEQPPVPKKRGRPRKVVVAVEEEQVVKRPRGRPPKAVKRGRPKKKKTT